MSEAAINRRTAETPVGIGPSETLRPVGLLGGLSNLSPFALIREFTSELDRVFQGNGSRTGLQAWAPAMDVQQCGGNLVIAAEVPGLRKDDVKVEVTDENLIIEGERKLEHKEDHEGYHRWERNYGRFYRAISLPDGAKTEQMKAELKDGVLRVSIPVPETRAKVRQIPISG